VATDPSPMSGADRNAFEQLSYFFRQEAGFSDEDRAELEAVVRKALIEGYDDEASITLQLNNTKAYKQRFGGVNEDRKAKGLAALSPRAIVGMEGEYKVLFRQYGLPADMFDSPDDLRKYVANDVSKTEMQDRLNLARAAVTSDDPFIRDTYRAWYASGLNEGDAIAAVLNPEKALPEIERKVRAAQFGGAATQQGLGLTESRATELANLGGDPSRARQQFGAVKDIERRAGTLAGIYGQDYGGQRDAEDAVFLENSDAAERIRKIGSRERAEFGGRAAGDSRSLGSTRY
jgi:hypothetical protein